MSKENVTKAAILVLEGLLISRDTDIETIAAMPIEEVEEGLRQMGLNPDQSLPPKISQLIAENKSCQQPPAGKTKRPYELLKQMVGQKHNAHSIEHESQTTIESPTFARAEREEQSQTIRYRDIRTGRFEDADTLYRKGLNAYKDDYIDQAIEYWREAKIIFLCIDMRREIAACDRSIGVAFQKLGQSHLAIELFKRAKNVYLGIGLIEQVASCNSHIRAAYRELTGHSWR